MALVPKKAVPAAAVPALAVSRRNSRRDSPTLPMTAHPKSTGCVAQTALRSGNLAECTQRRPARQTARGRVKPPSYSYRNAVMRSEEHTSELQSRLHLVCRLL